jgi:leader peptidase (prepilin peptidase) / N-methyltransferase
VEVVAALIGVFPFLLFPAEQAFAITIFGWLLLPLVILDFQHLWLPIRLVLLLAAGGLIASPLLSPDILWQDRAIGAAVGFLSLEIIRRTFKWLRGQEGMGAGDPKLFAAIGLWLGWAALPFVLLVASGIGIATMLVTRAARREHDTQFPFGSYMGIAAYCVALTA